MASTVSVVCWETRCTELWTGLGILEHLLTHREHAAWAVQTRVWLRCRHGERVALDGLVLNAFVAHSAVVPPLSAGNDTSKLLVNADFVPSRPGQRRSRAAFAVLSARLTTVGQAGFSGVERHCLFVSCGAHAVISAAETSSVTLSSKRNCAPLVSKKISPSLWVQLRVIVSGHGRLKRCTSLHNHASSQVLKPKLSVTEVTLCHVTTGWLRRFLYTRLQYRDTRLDFLTNSKTIESMRLHSSQKQTTLL